MAEYATALIRRFSMEALPVEVVATGGLFQQDDSMLMKCFREEVRRTAPQARIVRPALPPAAGAVLLALDACGSQPSPHTLETLQRSLPELRLEKSAAVAHEAPENGFSFPFFY
jgi:hypothetical protein